jgi:hypothetical protein
MSDDRLGSWKDALAEVKRLRNLVRIRELECNRAEQERDDFRQREYLRQLEAERLRGRLAELEYAREGSCPACSATEGLGHYPGCWMAEELGRGQAGASTS